ncbi:hypothetical protein ISS07_00080 [Candidatus Woesearchaeota archaeon]|nr:hypothetical protein [Candidatus Woesearchaeota archaeon]
MTKKEIDRKLKKYFHRHLDRGCSNKQIVSHLSAHGFDQQYLENFGREVVSRKRIAHNLSLISIIFLVFVGILSTYNFNPDITGLAVLEPSISEGCCTDLCQQGTKKACSGNFIEGELCSSLPSCLIGCCIDVEGYCLGNYLQGNCQSNQGQFVSKQCFDINFCKFVTDKPIIEKEALERQKYSKKSKLSSNALRKGSFLTINHLVYDSREIVKVEAEIKNDNRTVDKIRLYDDGKHKDADAQDGVYGNLWDSSNADAFEKTTVYLLNIVITKEDGSIEQIDKTQNFGVLSNNKCFPIQRNFPVENRFKDIIFLAQSYDFNNNFLSFRQHVDYFISYTESVLPDEIKKFSISRIDTLNRAISFESIKTFTQEECSYYTGQDTIIIFDKNEKSCTSEEGIIKLNPNFFFKQSLQNFDLFNSIGDLCDHVITEDEFLDIINSSLTPPTVTFSVASGTTLDGNINISMSIEDNNYPDDYEVYLNGTLVGNGTVVSNNNVALPLTNLENGHYGLLVKTRNFVNVFSFSELILLDVNLPAKNETQ